MASGLHFQVYHEPLMVTVDGAAPAEKGTELEGLEYLYASTIWARHKLYNATNNGTVPERVTSQVALGVEPSRVASGRPGVFVKDDVVAGDLIFSIKQPLLNIIKQGPGLSYCCDNCMVGRVNIYSTGPDKNIKFNTCSGCKILYYCSKDCQTAAWNHHHKFECKTFRRMNEAGFGSVAQMTDMRFVIRALQMHAKGRMSDAEWNEILSLPNHREAITKSEPHLEESSDSCARAAARFTETTVDLETIKHLLYLVLTTPTCIVAPSLKGARCYDPRETKIPISRSTVDIGKVVDTFVALIQHCCQSNALLWYERSELRVRASKDIRSGDELTFCYASAPYDYIRRRGELMQMWGLDCSCELCASKGPVSLPEGALRAHAERLSKLEKIIDASEIEKAIGDILQAGYGYGVFPLWDLYYQTIRVNFQEGRTWDCLKAALKMYYLVEPAQIPETDFHDRISTLYLIVSLMNVPLRTSTMLKELPDDVKCIIPHVFLHLRAKLVADTEKCFGVDSAVARFEKDYFRSILTHLEEVAHKQGYKFEYEPLRKSESERMNFLERMNDLLGLAEIPARTEAQLLEVTLSRIARCCG